MNTMDGQQKLAAQSVILRHTSPNWNNVIMTDTKQEDPPRCDCGQVIPRGISATAKCYKCKQKEQKQRQTSRWYIVGIFTADETATISYETECTVEMIVA